MIFIGYLEKWEFKVGEGVVYEEVGIFFDYLVYRVLFGYLILLTFIVLFFCF